jgi:hypothetical protein
MEKYNSKVQTSLYVTRYYNNNDEQSFKGLSNWIGCIYKLSALMASVSIPNVAAQGPPEAAPNSHALKGCGHSTAGGQTAGASFCPRV